MFPFVDVFWIPDQVRDVSVYWILGQTLDNTVPAGRVSVHTHRQLVRGIYAFVNIKANYFIFGLQDIEYIDIKNEQ